MVATATVVATLGAAFVAYRVVNPSTEFSKERVLWLSVIRQCLMDAEGRSEVEPDLIYRATKWLTRLTHSFLTVCSLAGFSKEQAIYLQEEQRRKLL